eukprot:m.36081 g.36081  ORF g.36081 m.36081 type:complete len:289 (-) comp5374_c0_seq1:4996-5862(-)
MPFRGLFKKSDKGDKGDSGDKGKAAVSPPSKEKDDKEKRATLNKKELAAAAAAVVSAPPPAPAAVPAAAPPAIAPSTTESAVAVQPKYERKKRDDSRIDAHYAVFSHEAGTVMDRLVPGRKPQEVCVCFSPKTFLISWFAGSVKGKPGTQLGQVDLAEIKEIRVGLQAMNSKDFKAGLESTGEVREKLALCIMHGTEFRLKQLCFLGRREDEVEAWANAINYHLITENGALFYDYPLALPRWIEKHWQALDRQQKQSIVSKDIRIWLQRINYKLSPKEIKDYFQMVAS